MAQHTAHHEEGHEHHVVPIRIYSWTLIWLLILLVVTVGAGFLPMPVWLGTTVALAIALVKTFLVMSNFMHVRFSGKMVWLFAAAGFLWLIIMIIFAYADYITRPWEPVPGF